MVKWIETTGRSEEDAITAALFQLGLDRDDVSVEVIERAKSGFLGFGSNPAKVRVSYQEVNGVPRPIDDAPLLEEEPPKPAPKREKAASEKEEAVLPASKPKEKAAQPAEKAAVPPAPAGEVETILSAKPGMVPPRPRQPKPERRPKPRREEKLQRGDEVLIGNVPAPAPHEPVAMDPVSPDDEKANQIKTFLTGLLNHLRVEAVPEIFITNEGNYKVILQGKDLGAVIGRRGETLDAIQQLTSYTVNRGQSKRVRIHIDAEGYRAKREESLRRLAVKVAGKVIKYRKNMTLEPMNAYERHVIHTALQDFKGVTTYSTGVEPNRRTVVAYAPDQR